MTADIYDPLTEYVKVFKPRFKDVAESTFDKLALEAGVDAAANKATCQKLYRTEELYSKVRAGLGWTRFWCAVLWIVIIGAVVVAALAEFNLETELIIALGAAVVIAALLLIFAVRPKLKKLKAQRDSLDKEIRGLRNEAWAQMAPLNRLYDWDILTRMMTKTVPRLEFDPYFTTQRLADLQMTYGWDGSFNAERSVLYSHSGLINGNPFVLCRTRKMEMGSKTYYGHKTITWTTIERGSDGKSRTVHHSQTLTAEVTAPYPEYFEKTRLIYGNTAAPDLIFNRRQNDLAGRENSWEFKRNRRKLRKKARNLGKGDFAMLTNEDFEVAFNTSDRNDNQQFALLFTPLAQESMLKLLKDNIEGYGDDFDFLKNKMINIIIPDHVQELNLDMNPERYHSYDFEKARADFYKINAELFRAVYFSLAPLLCVPMYQQIRSQQDIYGRDMMRESAFWEHEALANFWGQDRFKHPTCVTDCILKTAMKKVRSDGGAGFASGSDSVITVYAHGYRSEQRVTYKSCWGGDGRMHSVPVYWDEYLPVTGVGKISIREDNSTSSETASTQTRRLDYIAALLDKTGLDLYRRHIASKVL